MTVERKLALWVTLAATLVSLGVAFGPPLTWFAFSYERIAGGVEAEAEMTSHLLTQVVGANPELWEFEQVRLTEYLSRRPRRGDAEIRRVLGPKGDLVAERADPLPRPWIRRSMPLLDAGIQVGTVEITRSLRPTLVEAGFLALLLVAPALLTFRALRTLPIEALRRTEGELRQQRDAAQRYLEVAGVAFVHVDDMGRITLVNRMGTEILGRPAADLLGRDWGTTLLEPAERERVVAEVAAAAPGAVFHFEVPIAQPSGARRVLDAWATPLGRGGGLLLSAVDITEQRRLEEELRVSQKLRAVGRLADGVAHDFDEIVGAIRKRAAALRSDLELGNPHRLEAEEILAGAERASALTQSLLAFSRRQAAAADPIDLGELLLRTERRLRRLLPDEILFDVAPVPCALPVVANPLQVEQLLAHVVTAARDSVGGAGQVAMELSSIRVAGEVARRAGLPGAGAYALLSVTAMTGATPPAPLDPLAEGEEYLAGTGLEPALSAGIVEQHRGALKASLAPGKGGRCCVLLPLAGAAAGAASAT